MKNQHGRPNRPNWLRARKSLESIVSVVISLMTNTISRYHLHLGNMQDFEQYTGMTISICSVTYKLITAQSVWWCFSFRQTRCPDVRALTSRAQFSRPALSPIVYSLSSVNVGTLDAITGILLTFRWLKTRQTPEGLLFHSCVLCVFELRCLQRSLP